jgi:hypothetical protein
MTVRLLTLLVAVALSASGQTGLFGPVSSRPEAGDLAPDITFSRVLSAPAGTSWNPSKIFGRMTILTFLPDISDNAELITRWNALVDEFASKPLQFVFITGEKEASLLPSLTQHPLKGFVLLDRSGETARAYGLKEPETAIIGADGRIVGFDREILPVPSTLNAALQGRITIGPLQPGWLSAEAFFASHNVLLDARAWESPTVETCRADFPPSGTLHVTFSQQVGTDQCGGDDFRSLKGYDVKGAVSLLYDVNRIRIELPASFDAVDRYDFSVVVPEPEAQDQMNERFRQGIPMKARTIFSIASMTNWA